MPHLDPERLAALDHDVPSPDEVAHLATCAECRLERLAYERLAQLSYTEGARVEASAPRLTEWTVLSAQLRAAGLLTRPSEDTGEQPAVAIPLQVEHAAAGNTADRIVRVTTPIGPAPRVLVSNRVGVSPRALPWRAMLRLAAALALVIAGVAMGRLSAGLSLSSTLSSSLAGGTPLTPAGGLADGYASMEDASRALERAQQEYQRASMWLVNNDTTVNAQAVYRARLAALDQMMTASRAGLYEAPQDPVLNQYYLAAYTAREATLRQLGASLPVDRVMERF